MSVIDSNNMNKQFMRYYKDRDFPEVKVSNADIVAIIERPKQLERVISEHNELLDEVIRLEGFVFKLRKVCGEVAEQDTGTGDYLEDLCRNALAETVV